MVLVDFPLKDPADSRWMSIFAARVAPSAANAWTVTGESIRLRSPSTPEELRASMAVLRQVVAQTTADYNAAGSPSEAGDDPMPALQQVIDDEFGPG
jgi:hypothetical protein